jgi:hypothetical protein
MSSQVYFKTKSSSSYSAASAGGWPKFKNGQELANKPQWDGMLSSYSKVNDGMSQNIAPTWIGINQSESLGKVTDIWYWDDYWLYELGGKWYKGANL